MELTDAIELLNGLIVTKQKEVDAYTAARDALQGTLDIETAKLEGTYRKQIDTLETTVVSLQSDAADLAQQKADLESQLEAATVEATPAIEATQPVE